MPNPYVNKVVQSNGTTLIDISDTTAVAADVASGKYFYLATGEKVEGTGSGGGDEPSGPTYETYFDDSINVGEYGISIASLADLYFAEGETWRVTWDGVEYICTTAQYQGWLWTVGNQSLASTDDGINEPFLLYNYGGGAMNGNARTAGTHTLKLEKQTSSGSGGGSGLEYETGTYTAAADGNPSISFANTHSAAPAIIVFMDVSTSYIDTTAGTQYGFFDYVKLFGANLKTSRTLQRDGAYQWARVGTSGSTSLGSAILPDTTTQVTSSGFTPNFNSNSYKCKSGQTYKWIAIWAPTS